MSQHHINDDALLFTDRGKQDEARGDGKRINNKDAKHVQRRLCSFRWQHCECRETTQNAGAPRQLIPMSATNTGAEQLALLVPYTTPNVHCERRR